MSLYRSRKRRHWSERSWWNPRRWLAAPLVVGAAGAAATLVGLGCQAFGGNLVPWGLLALVGTLASVGAMAWAQSDINHLKNRER